MLVPEKHFYSCNALRTLRYSACLGCSVSLRSLSYCLQLRLIPHGSSCVLYSPSLNRSFITFHSTSFADPLLLQRWASCPTTQSKPFAGCTSTSASQHTSLTGFHCTAFSRVSFSTVQSTRCHTFLLAGRPFRLRLLCAANCFCRTSSSQSCTSAHLHTSAACMPFGKFMQAAPYVASICRLKAAFTAGPFRGLAVASVRPSLRRLMARFAPCPSPPLLPAGYASFLPQALLPANAIILF
jgi:hypothetical protein